MSRPINSNINGNIDGKETDAPKPLSVSQDGAGADQTASSANTGETMASETGAAANVGLQKEIGGQKGPEPTRYGDWEKNGRCTDF